MYRLKLFGVIVSATAWLALPLQSVAQEAAGAVDEAVEQIHVTGSHIKRSSFEGPSPVQVLSRDDFEVQQAVIMTDLTKRLTANSGAEFQEDQFNANSTSGTASINLRGLGIGSTLVLINGRRAVGSPGTPNTGAAFTDINNFPIDMIERVEIVKDGAAAIYGSDAVAGVVNFITRKDFEGFELSGSWQGATQQDLFSNDQQQDMRLGALFGASGERARIVGNISWFNRSPLDAESREFTQAFADTGTLLGLSGLGNPPTFIPLFASAVPAFDPIDTTGNGVGNIPFGDPLCESIPGGNSFLDPIGIRPGDGFCRFQFAPAFELVARETRIDAFTTFEYDVTDSLQIYLEGGFNFHRNKRTTSPSFPFLAFPVIGTENPGNPTNSSPLAADGTPVVFLGRAFGTVNAVNDGAEISRNSLDTWRVVGGLRGNLGDALGMTEALENWEFDVDYLWSQSRLNLRTNDTLRDPFLNALAGLGGTKCVESGGSPGDAATGGDCFFFNPFGSGILAQPGDPQFNDPDVLKSILATIDVTTTTELQVFDFGVSNSDLFELPGGSAGFAAGFQFRSETFDVVPDDNSAQDEFAFVVGTPPAHGDRDVFALYAEMQLPFLKGLETQLALRFEEYERSGRTLDPKVGLRARPFEMLDIDSPMDVTLRANFSTGFRAPSLNQQFATQTVLTGLVDFGSTSQTFRAVRTFGSKELDSEQSTVWSTGITLDFDLASLGEVTLSTDWWYFDYKDIIVKPSAQAILDAAAGSSTCLVEGCRAIIRDPGTGQILRIETEFFNAASTITDGFDFGVRWKIDPNELFDPGMDLGSFLVTWDATWIRRYQIQGGAGSAKQRVENSRNFNNFASSIPDFRFNLRVIWTWENLTLANSIQYITDYRDDECLQCAAGQSFREVDSFTSWDIVATYRLEGLIGDGTTFSIGLLNALDEDPPPVLTNGGYDSTIHDARGRLFQVGITQRF